MILFLKNIFVSTLCLFLQISMYLYTLSSLNPLTPNVNYSGRTAPLTSKVAFYIFGIYSPFFFLFKMQFVS